MVEFDHVTGGYGDNVLFRDLSTAIQAKSCVGIVGQNGVGKSTLFKLLTREIQPLEGNLYRAPRVKLAIIDQARTGLDDTDTLFDSAGGGNSHVTLNGHSIHVASFLRRFMFRADQHDQRVSSLSGGERMRLLIAKLLLEGANVLLLDEPTNDLDLMTLRILEEALIAFDGASLVISHDRALLDRVCTAVLSFDGGTEIVRYASRMQALDARNRRESATDATPTRAKGTPKKMSTSTGLSHQERKELETLPEQLERLEAEVTRLGEELARPETYQGDATTAATLGTALKDAEQAVATTFARWEELEGRS
jgi:ATP-binding cassette subfamily F protein uup